jgi:hypothetical protein
MANKLNTPQGQVMTLDQALDMQDLHGEKIEWKEVEGKAGSYTATVERKGVKEKSSNKQVPGRRYIYSIDPYSPTAQPVVLVSMFKEVIKPKKEMEADAEAGLRPVVPEKESSSSTSTSTSSEESEVEEEEEEEEGKAKRSYTRRT